MWLELREILTKLVEVYQQMLGLSKQKRIALVGVNISEIERITKQEQVLLSVVNHLERDRKKVLLKIRKNINDQYANADILTLILQCNDENKASLIESHERLKEIIEKVQTHNKTNTDLTMQALSAVNYQLNVLSQASVAPTYADGGKEVVDRKKRLNFEV